MPNDEGTAREIDARERAILCAQTAADFKGRGVLILSMRELTPLYDYLVLVTGTSRRHIHTLAEEIDDALSKVGDRRLSIEGYDLGKWVIQDYGDVVVHIFDDDTRDYFALEDLWTDAPRVDWNQQ